LGALVEDLIVVDDGGDTETSVCGGLMGNLAENCGIRGATLMNLSK
jgi:regulator of RNase E activity RraA